MAADDRCTLVKTSKTSKQVEYTSLHVWHHLHGMAFGHLGRLTFLSSDPIDLKTRIEADVIDAYTPFITCSCDCVAVSCTYYKYALLLVYLSH